MLTSRFVGSVKPGAARQEWFDENVSGLALRVQPTGAKSWAVLYRHRGRLRRLTLGDADAIPLATARTRRAPPSSLQAQAAIRRR